MVGYPRILNSEAIPKDREIKRSSFLQALFIVLINQ